jgi:Reverse transcriptase (RNA-dependent DNA polymerase)
MKARIVVRGDCQVPGRDIDDTYSPTLCRDSLCHVLALSCLRRMYSFQLDVKTAFLYGPVTEEIFVELPKFVVEEERRVTEVAKFVRGSMVFNKLR